VIAVNESTYPKAGGGGGGAKTGACDCGGTGPILPVPPSESMARESEAEEGINLLLMAMLRGCAMLVDHAKGYVRRVAVVWHVLL